MSYAPPPSQQAVYGTKQGTVTVPSTSPEGEPELSLSLRRRGIAFLVSIPGGIRIATADPGYVPGTIGDTWGDRREHWIPLLSHVINMILMT